MPSFNEIAIARLGLPDAHVAIAVRTDEDAAADPRSIPGAVRRDRRRVGVWARGLAGRRVVVLRRRGRTPSQGVAAWARHDGAEAGHDALCRWCRAVVDETHDRPAAKGAGAP